MLKKIKPLETNATRTTTNLATPEGTIPLITRGFKKEGVVLHPLQDWKYTDWALTAIASGLQLATFSYRDLALGKSVLLLASQLDWRGATQREINPETIRQWKSILEFIEI